MAEFNIIQSTRDAVEFAKFLQEEISARFFLDQSPTSALAGLDGLAGLYDVLCANPTPPLLFVTSPRWQRAPLYSEEVHTNDGRHFWSINPRDGGPAFTWATSRFLSNRSGDFFTAGSFGDYHYYYERPGSSDTFDRPSEMASAYQAALRYVRRTHSRARFAETGRAGPWVGSDAQRWHRIGAALGPDAIWTLTAA